MPKAKTNHRIWAQKPVANRQSFRRTGRNKGRLWYRPGFVKKSWPILMLMVDLFLIFALYKIITL
jgi:hypothetical protein